MITTMFLKCQPQTAAVGSSINPQYQELLNCLLLPETFSRSLHNSPVEWLRIKSKPDYLQFNWRRLSKRVSWHDLPQRRTTASSSASTGELNSGGACLPKTTVWCPPFLSPHPTLVVDRNPELPRRRARAIFQIPAWTWMLPRVGDEFLFGAEHNLFKSSHSLRWISMEPINAEWSGHARQQAEYRSAAP